MVNFLASNVPISVQQRSTLGQKWANCGAVVSLPANIFQPYSGVKTSVLFVDRALARRREDTYFAPATTPKTPNSKMPKPKYPNLDFFVSFEDGKKVFVRKYEITPGVFRFTRVVNNPLIKDLFSMVKSLWKAAHH